MPDRTRHTAAAVPAVTRRSLLRSAGAGTLAAVLGGAPAPTLAAPDTGTPGFTEVPAARTDRVTVPAGYTARVLLPWGAPISPGGPAWRPDAANTAAQARQQVGTGHSGLHYLPLGPSREGTRNGVLVIGHAALDPVLLHPDGGRADTAERAAKEIASLGATVVRVELSEGRWRMARDELNRRITADTPVVFSGPLAGHGALDTGADPLGTTGGSAHAVTPWHTYLTGEDTFADAFGTRDSSWRPRPVHEDHGLTADSARGWHRHLPRFDLARTPGEADRFGWVVEIDPFDPQGPPAKRTALGRLGHTGLAVAQSRGRPVVYMTDAAHAYKFVAARPWQQVRRPSVSPLDEGTLYALRLDADGTGTWLPLVHGRTGLTVLDGFADQAAVLLRARRAAAAVGATAFRGPGRPAVHPGSGEVYLPEADGSGGGRLLAWTEGALDHAATVLAWREFARAGEGFAAPGGAFSGADGRLWITTDVAHLGWDAGRERLGNSALLCADPHSGRVRRFLTGPRGCGIAGVSTTPDQRTLFVAVREPGSSDARWGEPTAEDPRAVGNWPGFDPRGRPRCAVVAVRKDDGGAVGT
ncbi:PhoX family phosphatase [Nocardiopsis sp. CC223A]|uniref:PhoX family protein n=1 Tax=Nocardiopsis sp. CC223A TaxID=3044051 RepID=UPI00278C532B|nr:alkaline phosphatase PhoX [Nocardiopsis sp. CC223A]